jgi:hypothetical protein
MNSRIFVQLLPAGMLACLACGLHAQTRTSASYALVTETTAAGAAQSSGGGALVADTDTGGTTAGISTGGSFTLKHGFAGQLTDPLVLNIRPESDPADESTVVQMLGQVILDDRTLLALQGSDLDWAEIEGPISTINGDGQATLGAVTADTRATVLGSYQNVRTSVSFIVADVQPPPIVLPIIADPHSDRDGDGQSDLFEALAGYRANDANDFFSYEIIEDGDGVLIALSKVVPGTRYIIEASTDLRIYRKVATIDPEEEELGHFIFDRQAFERAKYYRVRLESLEEGE